MELPDLDRRDYILMASALIVSVSLGVAAGSLTDSNDSVHDFEFDRFVEVTVNGSQNTNTVELENASIDLMFEDRTPARAYIDRNQDGSADKRLELNSSSVEQTGTVLVTKNRKSYRLYYRYLTNSNTSDESYLTVYRVLRIQ